MTAPSRARRRLLEASEIFVGARLLDGPIEYFDAERRVLGRLRRDEEMNVASVLVDQVWREVAEAWTVVDGDGEVFSIARYEASDQPAFAVTAPDGEPLGTYLCEGGFLHEDILVRDETSAPVAEVDTVRQLHQLRARHGPGIAICKRLLERYGDEPVEEVWWMTIDADQDLLDPRMVLALPVVCALTGSPPRRFDPDGVGAGAVLLAVPPVGAALLLVEAAIDGWYWLRRQLD